VNNSIPTLLHVFSTFAVGGPQMRFVQIANHFGPAYRHRIVAMDGKTSAFERLAPGLDVSMITIENRRGQGMHNVRRFITVLNELRPDVLVTSNWGTIEWAAANRFPRIPHIHMEDGFGPDEAAGQRTRRILARRLLLRHATTVVPSLTLFTIARDVWSLREKQILYIPNGVDCVRFAVAADPALVSQFSIGRGRPVIGAVSPLRPEKNLSRLLDSFALVRRERIAQLVLVGDGPQRAELEAKAVELGIADDVVFTGFCSTPENLLPAFAVAVVSSDTEQMPLSVLEAMAAGRPIAATDVGDVRNMVAPENHPFIVEKNAAKLAAAILRLLEDENRREAIGAANARRAAEAFDQSRMFAAYRTLFECGKGTTALDPPHLGS
jgi:glycosyltransferase involved in cell wall biosynthesis